MNKIGHIKTISEFHRTRRLEPPAHPLISLIDYAKVDILPELRDWSWRFDFYFISLKRNLCGKIRYGQQMYDFDEGVMFFIGPGQVFRIDREPDPLLERSGWMLLIHPDFFWNSALASGIKRYAYFDYAIHEALFVSQKEEQILEAVLEHISLEYHGNLDAYSQQIIISQTETLLNYCERFYNRQFLTRKKTSHHVLEKLEILLTEYFAQNDLINKGLPTVMCLAAQLNVSPKYLTSLLRSVTGLSAQQHIHQQVIERAKLQLSKPELSIAEIAYSLGFGHPQSFSKFFKRETQSSPLAYRQAFN